MTSRTPMRLGQIALGLLWMADGLLKLQPYFFRHFADGVIAPNASGQPAVIGQPITWLVHLVEPRQAIVVLLAAFTEMSIGIGLLIPRTVKPALLVSFTWAIGVWLTGEGLGGLLTGSAPVPLTGVIGTAPLYILAGLLVWPEPPSGFGLLGERGARLAWATLWLGAAVLWLFPSNAGAQSVHDAVAAAPAGVGWLSGLQGAAADAVGGSGMTVAVVLAMASAEIGLSLLLLRGTRVALAAGMALALVFWVLAEGIGGIFTGRATDVGNGPLMVLIATLLLPLGSRERVVSAARPGRSLAADRV